MNNDDSFIHKYYAHFYHKIIMKMYFQNQVMIQKNKQFVIIKAIFWINYRRNERLMNGMYHCYYLFLTTKHIITYRSY